MCITQTLYWNVAWTYEITCNPHKCLSRCFTTEICISQVSQKFILHKSEMSLQNVLSTCHNTPFPKYTVFTTNVVRRMYVKLLAHTYIDLTLYKIQSLQCKSKSINLSPHAMYKYRIVNTRKRIYYQQM